MNRLHCFSNSKVLITYPQVCFKSNAMKSIQMSKIGSTAKSADFYKWWSLYSMQFRQLLQIYFENLLKIMMIF